MESLTGKKYVMQNLLKPKRVTNHNIREYIAELSTLSVLNVAQSKNPFCKKSCHTVGTLGSAFTDDRSGNLVR